MRNISIRNYALLALAALVGSLLFISFASAAGQPAAPGQNPLTCSEVFADNCTSNGKTATIDTTIGGAAAVYLPGYNSSFYGVRTALVAKLSNTVTGDAL